MPLTQGQVLNNRYRIASALAQGGFGAVYRAWDLNLNRACAVKENLDTSPEAQQQFGREAMILANLNHPHLARVTDYFFLPGQGQYLVMDFVDGEDLQVMLERMQGPLPEAQVVTWIGQVCDALAYLHAQTPPIIHRDLKPANIKITPDGQAVLVDFGVAKVYDPLLKTTRGARAVTPGYSPQEQYGQGSTDTRSDIYALGATLYTLLTGREPVESIQRNLDIELPAPRTFNPAIAPNVESAILRAMNMRPTLRYQAAADFKAALVAPTPGPSASQTAAGYTVIAAPAQPAPTLAPVTAASPTATTSYGKWALAAAGLVVLVVGGAALLNRSPSPSPAVVIQTVVVTQPMQTNLTVSAPASAVEPTAFSSVLYSSDAYGFSLRYPNGWVVEEQSGGVFFGSTTDALATPNPARPQGPALAIIRFPREQASTIIATGVTPELPESVLNAIVANNLSNTPLGAVTKQLGGIQTLMVASYPAARTSVSQTVSGKTVIFQFTTIVSGDIVTLIAAVAPDSQWSQNAGLFDQMLASLALQPRLAIPSPAPAQGQPLSVVSSLPMTGPSLVQTQTIVNAIKLRLEQANSQACGGKYTINYQAWDDASAALGQWDPAVETENANRAAADKSIVAYLGTFNSGAAKLSIPILDSAGPLIMVSPANTYPGLTKPGFAAGEPDIYYPAKVRNYARVVAADDIQGAVAARFVHDTLKASTVYILDDQQLYGKGIADVFEKTAGTIGLKVLGHDGIDTKAADYKALMTKISTSNGGNPPDAIYVGMVIDSNAAQLLKDKVAIMGDNTKVKYVGPDGIQTQATIDGAGASVAEGVYASVAGLPYDKLPAAGQQFVKDYNTKYNTNLNEPYAVYGYEAMSVVLRAIEDVCAAGGDPTNRRAVRDSVFNIKNFGGALGTWSFDANGDTSLTDMTFYVVRNGRYEPAGVYR